MNLRWLRVIQGVWVLLLVGPLALMAFGLLFPWKVAEQALSEPPGSLHLLVGASYDSGLSEVPNSSVTSLTYVQLPSSLRTLSTVKVKQDAGGTTVTVESHGFAKLLLLYVGVFFVGLWLLVFRPRTPSRYAGT